MLDKIKIVLVETSHPGNIGSSARAMKNMGLSDLCLVNPKIFPSDTSSSTAAHAKDVLTSATVTSSLTDAIQDSNIVIGLSARQPSFSWPTISLPDIAKQVSQEKYSIAFVFGRESSGLTTAELQKCNYHIQLPTADNYPSLNLSHAVQIVCYELFIASKSIKNVEIKEPLASNREVESLLEHLESFLIKVDFLDPKNPRNLIARIRRTFTRLKLKTEEINIFRGILNKTEQRLSK